jgi:hypothetical protein
MHARRLQAALRAQSGDALQAAAASASFFAEHILAHAPALASTIVRGGQSTLDFPDSAWLA